MVDSMADRLAVLHGLRLAGLAESGALAARTGLPEDRCAAELAAAQEEELVVRRQGRVAGWMLTGGGRAVATKLVADELDAAAARPAIEDAYQRFLSVNGAFLALCTDWQMIDDHTLNDHSDAAYDAAVLTRLGVLDDQVQRVCVGLGGALDRFAGYGDRLAAARRNIEQGDIDWFTSPRIDSYHTIWFELHEDLLVTLGIERSREAG